MRNLGAVVCLSLALAFAATPMTARAQAKEAKSVVNLWPLEFKISSAISSSLGEAYDAARWHLNSLSSWGPNVEYFCEVNLPKESTITRVAARIESYNDDSFVDVMLFRCKPGDSPGECEHIAWLSDFSGQLIARDWYEVPIVDTSKLSVDPGYRYFAGVYIAPYTFVYGVQVEYR